MAALILPQGILMFGLMAVMPWLPGGLDAFVDALFPGMAVGLFLFLPMILALRSHAWWGVCWFFCVGSILVAAYPFALFAGLVFPLRLVKATFPAATIVAYFGVGGLVALSPLIFLMIRALRLRYWQPWTLPEQWEVGDERAPDWAKNVTGLLSPRMRASFDAEKPAIKPEADGSYHSAAYRKRQANDRS